MGGAGIRAASMRRVAAASLAGLLLAQIIVFPAPAFAYIPGLQEIYAAIAKRGSVDVTFIRGRESIIQHLAAALLPGDVVITMGAGDIGSLGDALHERLETMRQAG